MRIRHSSLSEHAIENHWSKRFWSAWRTRSRSLGGMISLETAPDRSFTIAYTATLRFPEENTDGADRANAPVYRREDNKQEQGDVQTSPTTRCSPPRGTTTLFWKLRGIPFQGRVGRSVRTAWKT